MSHCSFYVPTVKTKAENELEKMILLFELSPTVAAEWVLIFWKFILKGSQ